MGKREQRTGARSIRTAALMLLALGVLLALVPDPAGHRADALDGAVVTAAFDADSVGVEAAVHPDHGDVACHGGWGCTSAAATLPEGVTLAVLGPGQRHSGAEPLVWSARPVRPDIKPPIR